MRKIHKKQMSELTNTLRQACQQLKSQAGQEFINLCAEIQDFTSGIYDFVQDILGEDTLVTKSLETFYKELFEASQGNVPVKRLQQLVHEIQGQVKGLQPDRMEVAFLCYKASMSDCFESVYFAAKSDPKCDAYFIPIPYYDRNADGSFGAMHLEGVGHYPDTYELVDWRKYDIEARHPDVIFIMNPYDEVNRVTSVHPDFYSKRLKDMTDCLIYIEYGIPLWMYRDARLAKEKIAKEAALLPAHFYCDFYIAYSQEIVKFFQTAFHARKDLVNAYSMDPKTIDTKAVALGSPKFDKVIYSKRESFKIPDNWKEKMQNKKVILYNTSLSELLKSTTKQFQETGSYQNSLYLNKLRSTLEIFYKRDDAMIWWRPHPLFENTLKSMRPELYQEYQSIVQEFCSQDCGIYDTTDNLHRAICWSNAMISDESSLLWLYLASGKPFYIPAISMALKNPKHQDDAYFYYPIQRQIEKIKKLKQTDISQYNICINWSIFADEDFPTRTHIDHFTERFLRYVIPLDDYPEQEEYESLKKQLFEEFVANADGTAGQKIYEFAKQKIFDGK